MTAIIFHVIIPGVGTPDTRTLGQTGNVGKEFRLSEPDQDSERQARIDKGIKNLARFALDRKVWIYRIDRTTRPNRLFDPLSAEEIISDDKLPTARQIVEDALSCMSERERFVVMAHFGLSGEQPRTFRDIGEELQLSPSWVRDINSTALSARRIREPLSALNDLALKGRRVIEVYR